MGMKKQRGKRSMEFRNPAQAHGADGVAMVAALYPTSWQRFGRPTCRQYWSDILIAISQAVEPLSE